ncbi:hypothetical protein OG357_25700 [Streptomyces sp. NBC_01255]|uniref:hypothetical protein n=1 Tax=Streptomyces sp. NBC_01255 TaxID=2903798 RepID=UPI002E3479FE|nr:hypothetical protein [Streptomyces sp. NBC_01255]
MTTFTQLTTEYAARIADLIGASRNPAAVTTERDLIALVQDAADSLRDSVLEDLQDAAADLDTAAYRLTDALASRGTDRDLHLARAESHIRLALELAS